MRPRLIIRLGSDHRQPVRWFLLDREGGIQDQGVTDDLALLAEQADDRPVTGLVSAADVLLTSAVVPTQSRQKLLRAIPYALEDSVAGDVEAQHFVLGQRTPAGDWPVAVVDVAWLEDWLRRLEEAGLGPTRLLPEPLCLPLETETWTVLLDGDGFAVRTGPQQGFGGDRDNLLLLLEAALEERGEQRPHTVVVYGAQHTDLPAELAGVPLEPRALDDAPALLARGLDDPHQIQLLTGPYAPASGQQSLWRPWLPAAILFAAWVTLDTGHALTEQQQMRNELAELESRNLELLRHIFPEATSLQAARTRVDNRLAQLRGGGTAADSDRLLETLEAVGPVLAGGEGFRLTGLSYRNGNLELELTVSDLQRLDRLQQELDANEQLQAEVRSARAEDEAVQGRLLVRRGS
ncbi:MAG: type II secretion system protein GspL [Ectothiorhodospiraceae bacterium]|nr:type II secretion system protein GspL [Ectothiorhodospiraceae bacterium]